MKDSTTVDYRANRKIGGKKKKKKRREAIERESIERWILTSRNCLKRLLRQNRR